MLQCTLWHGHLIFQSKIVGPYVTDCSGFQVVKRRLTLRDGADDCMFHSQRTLGISCMFLTCFSLADGRPTCETWWAGWMPKTAPTWTMDYNASRRPFQGTWLGGSREGARGILPNFLRNSVGSDQEDQQFCPVARLQDHGGGELLHCRVLDQQPPACAKDGSSRTCGASLRR